MYSPLSGLWGSITRTAEVVGYSRAASELARMGSTKKQRYVGTG